MIYFSYVCIRLVISERHIGVASKYNKVKKRRGRERRRRRGEGEGRGGRGEGEGRVGGYWASCQKTTTRGTHGAVPAGQ